jgi:VanZ family protein
MKWPVRQNRGIARALAWFGIAAIFVFSVVPADERPVTDRFTLTLLLPMALLFCGGIELLQVPLPTRHARVSDFAIDLLGSYFAIGLAAVTSRSRAVRPTPKPPTVSG